MEPRGRIGAWTSLVVMAVAITTIVAVGCSARPTTAATAPSPTSAAMSAAPVAASAATQTGPAVNATANPTVAPTAIPTAAAAELQQARLDGATLPAGGWAARGIVLSFQAPTVPGQMLIPQVEVVPGDQSFVGTPTAKGTPISATGADVQARITVNALAPGQYHWQARFANAESDAAGPWVAFSTGVDDFGLAGPPPSIQDFTLTGASHRAGDVPIVGAKDRPTVSWTVSTQPNSPLDHLVYAADHQKVAPPTPPAGGESLDAGSTSLPLGDLADGDWELHVWAVDRAGQAGAPATLAVRVQRTPPQFTDVLFRTWVTNPLYQTAPISFTVSEAAQVSLSILPASGDTAVRTYDLGQRKAGEQVRVSWDGKDAKGSIVPVGSYRFVADATDAAGNQTQSVYSGLQITNKVIKVFLASESMTAYEGNQVFLSTVITSGGQALPTRPGQFEIQEKASPFVFHAQFPRGSPYWFPDVTSHYAMLFDPADANFIHDAPWRSVYGPGTNGPGIPGSVHTGSHGCVETPGPAMVRLWGWTPMGTPVIVEG
jgi:hypothetical protein